MDKCACDGCKKLAELKLLVSMQVDDPVLWSFNKDAKFNYLQQHLKKIISLIEDA
jgi:hypothetical protein